MLDFERILQLKKDAGVLAVATIVRTSGSTPRATGAKMAVLRDGMTEGSVGGGRLERLVIQDALRQIKIGGTCLKRYRLLPKDERGIGVECGGNAEVFIEVLGKREHLLIFGGGHIGQALSRMAPAIDFRVTVVDDRKDYAMPERLGGAETLHSDFSNPALRKLVTRETYIVIATHGHVHDGTVLKNIISTRPRYIGMIGSKRKVATIMESLKQDGVSAGKLRKVFSPIGLDIGAETPEEIAVSILSEIINIRRKGESSPIGMGRKH